MAQVAQSGTNVILGSLVRGGREKSRNWAFTLNNPMEAEKKNLQNDDYAYIFQEETGKEGTPHLQGTICLKMPQALSYMKKINARAHWEVCKNKHASINYCRKGETRTGDLYTNMDMEKEFGTMAHGTEPIKNIDFGKVAFELAMREIDDPNNEIWYNECWKDIIRGEPQEELQSEL